MPKLNHTIDERNLRNIFVQQFSLLFIENLLFVSCNIYTKQQQVNTKLSRLKLRYFVKPIKSVKKKDYA